MSTAKDQLGAHLKYFGQKLKEYQSQGLNTDEAQLKAVTETNALYPLTEAHFRLLSLMSEMSERQKVAYGNPCRTPYDLLSRRYHKDIYDGERVISSSVTVMVVQWPPVWHASVALLGATMQPQPLKRMAPRQITAARRVLEKLLAGVGNEPGEFIETSTSLQLQKPMKDEELEGLREKQDKAA